MRIARVVSLAGLSAVLLGAPAPAGEKDTPRPRAEAKATQDDADVITAAIKHFSEQEDEWSFIGRDEKKGILVHKESGGPRGSDLSDELVQSDSLGDKWEVPGEAADDLRRRNAKAAPLRDLKFGERVLFADLTKVTLGFSAEKFPKEFAEAKAHAHAWLPGYSKDGTTAVIRFSFGPTAHGATATYLLVKKGGAWTVTKWSHTYYA